MPGIMPRPWDGLLVLALARLLALGFGLKGRRRGGAADAGRLAAEVRRDAGRVRGRVRGQQDRRARGLVEVEVLVDVAEDGFILADVGAGIGPAVGGGVEPVAAEEVVLDELQVGIAAERLAAALNLP